MLCITTGSIRLLDRGHVLETITRHGRTARVRRGKMTEKQTRPGSRPPEPRATPKHVGKQDPAARDAAIGPNDRRILSGRSGAKATPPRYCDYYSFMSLDDFMTWIQKDDGSEPGISYSWQ
jgi:hypothetical protein